MSITRVDRIFSPAFGRVKGTEAWSQSLQAVTYACDKIRSSVGPRGACKMVSYNRGPERVTKVTKDAIPVLEELAIQNPLLTVVSEAAKMQREETGDGVASFIILLSGLLKRADELSTLGIHRNIIIKGYLEATRKALEIIDSESTKIADGEFADILQSVDCGSGILTAELRGLIVEAGRIIVRDGKLDKTKIRVVKKTGGHISDSKLVKGVVIKKEKAHPNMPDKIDNPRIAILTGETSLKRLEIKMPGKGRFPIKLDFTDPAQIAKYKEIENEFRTKFFGKIQSVKANVVCCQQPLDDKILGAFARQGIFALETVDKDDLNALSEATGAHPSANIKELSAQDLGCADSLQTEKHLLEKMVTFNGCNAATLLLRGSTPQTLDDLESTIRRSVSYLKTAIEDGRVLPGGGAVEMHIAQELKNFAKEFSSREQAGIQAFSEALTNIPRSLAENNGLNPTDIIIELKGHHTEGSRFYGVGGSGCSENVCMELAKAKVSMIRRAYEVVSLLLRIDEQIVSKEMVKFHK